VAQIRSMIEDDVAQIASIMSSTYTWQRYEIDQGMAAASLRQALVQAREPREADCIVACEGATTGENATVLGFAWVQYRGMFGMSAYLKIIGVAEEARGSGVGRLLLTEVEHRAFSRGPNLFLLVSDFNRPAIAFYEKMGYEKVGFIKDYVVEGIGEIAYRKTAGPIR